MSEEPVTQGQPQGYVYDEERRLKEWTPLKELTDMDYAFFERCLFLEGFDISSNIYVLTGDHLSLIDAGNDYTAFIQLFQGEYEPDHIKKIFLTHGGSQQRPGILERQIGNFFLGLLEFYQ